MLKVLVCEMEMKRLFILPDGTKNPPKMPKRHGNMMNVLYLIAYLNGS